MSWDSLGRPKCRGLAPVACIVGDGRHFLAALLVPNVDALAEAVRAGGDDVPADALLTHPAAERVIAECVKARLADLSHYEQVCRFVLLPREFDVPHGEMTLTMKLRRAQVAQNFAAEIARLFSTSERAPT